MIGEISSSILPLFVIFAGGLMLFSKRDTFSAFTKGASEGLRTTARLLPTLSALLVAIGMLRASGAVETVARWISPVTNRLGLPAELLPFLLTRPFSGSASTAAFLSLVEEVGADSFPGLCAAVIFGSSDTIVYVITVYFSSVGIKKTRWAFPCAVAGMLFCIFFSCFLCRIWFFR